MSVQSSTVRKGENLQTTYTSVSGDAKLKVTWPIRTNTGSLLKGMNRMYSKYRQLITWDQKKQAAGRYIPRYHL